MQTHPRIVSMHMKTDSSSYIPLKHVSVKTTDVVERYLTYATYACKWSIFLLTTNRREEKTFTRP